MSELKELNEKIDRIDKKVCSIHDQLFVGKNSGKPILSRIVKLEFVAIIAGVIGSATLLAVIRMFFYSYVGK